MSGDVHGIFKGVRRDKKRRKVAYLEQKERWSWKKRDEMMESYFLGHSLLF
jgi:hypothetical protein